MTNEEFRQTIAEAPNMEQLEKITVPFAFPYVKFEHTFTGISALYVFVNQQSSGWNEIQNLPTEFVRSKEYFNSLKESVIRFAEHYAKAITSSLDNILRSDHSELGKAIKQHQKYFLYDAPEVNFLLKIHNETPDYFPGALYFITFSSGNFILNNKNAICGAALAYEFALKDQTEITQRRNAEKSSISRIRNDFQTYLSESERQLVEHLRKTTESFEALWTEKETIFNEWFTKTQNEEWATWFKKSEGKMESLEETYKKKLKLEEPAKYWANRAFWLKIQGWMALLAILAVVIIAGRYLFIILCGAPDQIFASWLGDDKSVAIRWTIGFVTLVSLFGYGIRVTAKFMFSAFHLARDCEERHTLTYFYLSLLKDDKVEASERQLIMKSLFSRADTGLLKEDSSPTMPSDVLNLSNTSAK